MRYESCTLVGCGLSIRDPLLSLISFRHVLSALQDSFELHIDLLRHLDYDVLDVKISAWHDDYNHFKSNIKDLEVMFTNVINVAFDVNATVSEGECPYALNCTLS